MADKAEKQAIEQAEEAGFETRTSSEQREINEHVARTPDEAAAASASTALTGHTNVEGVEHDPRTGKVQSAHSTTVVTDPESPLAVQVPTHEEAPNVNATEANPLGVHDEPTPEEAFAAHADGDESVVTSTVSTPSDTEAASGIPDQPADEPEPENES